jgi:RNA polymerase sigma-70 factor (ECF subfamily)
MLPRPADASEVVQEVSVRLWEKWDSYDQDRPFLPWAMRFAYLQVLKWRQGKAREKLIFSDDLLSQINATNDYEEPLMEARRKTLTLCLEKLNKDDRRIVELRYGRHGAIKEEAKKTGVKMHKLYYALERIRIQLLNCIELNLQRSGLNDV